MSQLMRTLFSLCIVGRIVLPSVVYAEDAEIELNRELPTETHLPPAMLCDADGAHLFVALKTGGVAVFDVHNRQPRQLAVLE